MYPFLGICYYLLLLSTLDTIRDFFPETYFVYTVRAKQRPLAGNIDVNSLQQHLLNHLSAKNLAMNLANV